MLIVVCAMQEEAINVIRKFKLKQSGDYFESEDIRLIITGIGREKVREKLSKAVNDGKLSENDDVLNFGFAGGYKINTGLLLAVSQSFLINSEYKESGFSLDCPVGFYPSGAVVCFTSDKFVEHSKFSNPCLYDMELHEICKFPHKKIYSIKIVSDNLSESEFDKNIKPGAMDSAIMHVAMGRIERIMKWRKDEN